MDWNNHSSILMRLTCFEHSTYGRIDLIIFWAPFSTFLLKCIVYSTYTIHINIRITVTSHDYTQFHAGTKASENIREVFIIINDKQQKSTPHNDVVTMSSLWHSLIQTTVLFWANVFPKFIQFKRNPSKMVLKFCMVVPILVSMVYSQIAHQLWRFFCNELSFS